MKFRLTKALKKTLDDYAGERLFYDSVIVPFLDAANAKYAIPMADRSDPGSIAGILESYGHRPENGQPFREDEALGFLAEILGGKFNVPAEPGRAYEVYKSMLHLVPDGIYTADGFLAGIDMEADPAGPWSIRKRRLVPGTMNRFMIPSTTKNGAFLPNATVLDEPIEYPVLSKDGKPYLSVSPTELLDTELTMRELHGDVLCLGTGLGYPAYLMASQSGVDSVTVMDADGDLLDLTERTVLSRLWTKDKTKTVQADPFDYLESVQDGQYGAIYGCLWPDRDHLGDYIKFRHATRRFKKTAVLAANEYEMLLAVTDAVRMVLHKAADHALETAGEIPVFSKKDKEILETDPAAMARYRFAKRLTSKETVDGPAAFYGLLHPEYADALIRARRTIPYEEE